MMLPFVSPDTDRWDLSPTQNKGNNCRRGKAQTVNDRGREGGACLNGMSCDTAVLG